MSLTLAETATQTDVVDTLVGRNGTAPYSFSIVTDDDSKFAISGDDLVVRTAATFNYDTPGGGGQSHDVTVRVTDDNAETFDRVFTISITDVADGPTLTGASSDLETELGTPTVGTPLSFDARDIFVSPTGQTLTFSALSHGAMNVDGFTVEWTPTSQEYVDGDGTAAFSITATDEDGQSLLDVAFVAMTDVNTAPTAIDQTGTFSVPEGAAPAFVSSSPADDAADVAVATDPNITLDRNIKFGASGKAGYLYNVTGTTLFATYTLPGAVGAGAGKVNIVDDTLTFERPSNFAAGTEYAIKWDDGFFENLGGIPVAANTSNTFISFTTAAGASAPAQFSAGQWSVTDLATSLDIRIAISALPSDGGSSITDLEYQRDGGSWTSLAGTSTGNYDITVPANGTSYSFAIRAVNSVGNGTASATKNATATGVPGQFGTGDWSIADLGTTGDARITISTLAAANGATITDIEAQIDGGSWTSLGISTTTTADLTGFTDTVESDVAIRAVNSVGNGTASATKPVTTTAPSGGLVYVGGTIITNADSADFAVDLTSLTGGIDTEPSEDDIVLVYGGASSDGNLTNKGVKTAGWTAEGGNQFANDTRDANSALYYKIMTSTPDTTVDCYGSTSTSRAAMAVVHVWRGVDTSTPFDVTTTLDAGNNSGTSDPPSITPSTSGAQIIAMGYATSGGNNSTVPTGPSGMSNILIGNRARASMSGTIFMASHPWNGSGAYDPAAWTGDAGTTSDSWHARTCALRPA